MTRRLWLSALAAALLAAPSRVSRADLRSIEVSFDRRIQSANIDDPFDLLGHTRGVYLEKYGVVLTSEINLVTTGLSPFSPKPSREQLERLRQKKLARLDQLRAMMRDLMVTSATSLKNLSPDEQIAVGVSLFHQAWEDSTGLPSQILLQAPRKTLLDFEAGRLRPEALKAAIQEQVF